MLAQIANAGRPLRTRLRAITGRRQTVAGLGIKRRLREQAIAALITAPSVAIAAKQSGVSQRSLARWMEDGEFAAEVQAARNELLQGAIQRLKASAFDAVGVLMEIAANPASSDMARVSASKTLIELALRVGTIEALEKRIDELERGADGIEDVGTTARTIEGQSEQESGDGDSGEWSTAGDWQIAIPESVQ